MFDGKAFGLELVAEVRAYLARAVEPLTMRLAALEQAVSATGNVKALIAAEVAALPRPENGKDADLGEVARWVTQEVERALAAFPVPSNGIDGVNGKDGRDGVDGAPGRDGSDGKDGVSGIDGKDGTAGRDGIDGKDGAHGLDGKDGSAGLDGKDGTAGRDGVDGKDGAHGLDGKDGSAGLDGKDGAPGQDGVDGKEGMIGEKGDRGRDGVGLAGALIGRDGQLLVTLSNGDILDLGPVSGKDGLGFEDMTEELADDGRTIIRRYQRGDQVKEFRHTFAIVLDRGIWKDGTYQVGDGVTWGGSFWIAQKQTTLKPQTPEAHDDWRLAVKKGRDGKDGVVRTVVDKPIIKVP
jgi:collagen type III alpha